MTYIPRLCSGSSLTCGYNPIDNISPVGSNPLTVTIYCTAMKPLESHPERTSSPFEDRSSKILGHLAFPTAFTPAPEISSLLHSPSRHLKHDWETRSASSHLRHSILRISIYFYAHRPTHLDKRTPALRRRIRLVLYFKLG